MCSNEDCDDELGNEYDYFYCYCCGYSTTYHEDKDDECPRCTAIMSPEYY